MFRNLTARAFTVIVVIFTSLSLPVSAQDISLEAQILAGDIDAVEGRLTDLHRQHLAGEIQADDLRVEFSKFGQTNPALPSFIENWIAAYPASPYAQAAAAWNIRQAAWRMRGGDTVRFVWPQALSAFNATLLRSQDHGLQAFNTAPDLVAASDLILMNEAALNQVGANGVLELVDAVMAATPNRGTLYRAASAFNPRWGDNIAHIETLCDRYSDVVTSVDYASPKVCAADMVMAIYPSDQLREQAIDILSAAGWSGFESHQYSLYASIYTQHKSQLLAGDVAAYLQRDDTINYAMARGFYNDQFHNSMPDDDLSLKIAATQIILRLKDAARAAIVWDPGNAELVDTILYRTETAVDIATLPDFEGRLVLWGEVLRAAPFNPSHWNAAANAADLRSMDTLRVTWPFAINAITYSNHKPYYVNTVLTSRAMNYNWAQGRLDRGVMNPALQAEVHEELLCPTVRLSRLRTVICDASPSSFGCRITNQFRDDIVTEAFETASREGLCSSELTAPISELVFYPVSVDVGNYTHSPANPVQ